MDFEIMAGFVSFVALILVWAFAPQPQTAPSGATAREAMA